MQVSGKKAFQAECKDPEVRACLSSRNGVDDIMARME